jgi:hypothetical protein
MTEDKSEFMASKSFSENLINVDFGPEELIQKLNGGDQAKLKKRTDIRLQGINSTPHLLPP